MPSPTTALQLCRDALALTNAVGSDQTLTADETSGCVRVFNDCIELFSTQNMAVYGQANQTFNTVAAQSVYTIGSGGNWNTTRPERINSPAYSVWNSVSMPCTSMTQEEYNLIAIKTQTQEFPDRYLYVNEYPLGLVTLWPVPSAVTPVTFSIDRVISSVATAATTVNFPPGYAMAFKYKLAIMLAPEFGKKIANYPDIVQIANDSFADIKRANKKLKILMIDPAYGDSNYTVADYYRGW